MRNNPSIHFSEIQISMLSFFESKMRSSDLFKTKDNINKKTKEIKQSTGKNKSKKEEQLQQLEEKLENLRKEALKTVIPNWLTTCAEKALTVKKPMFKVTHPTKFTSGLIVYGGIYIKQAQDSTQTYLTTETLKNTYFDISNSNGNLISHGRFMMLKLDHETVYEKLEQGKIDWLFEFSNDKTKIKQWANGMSHWIGQAELPETSQLKQNYFHLHDNHDQYHLISPIFSSVMCQALYEKIRDISFDQDNAKRRKARKNKIFEEGILVEYPNIAIMNFGGTQPQNISVGNFERHGEAYFVPSYPPHWQSTLTPPITAKSLYEAEFDRRAWKLAKTLQSYLLQLHQQKGNKHIRDRIKNHVNHIIDTLLVYVSEIHSLRNQAGWSAHSSNLKQSHQLWLDPYRQDENFQNQRRSGEWQTEVCSDFGLWVNKKLEHKKMLFGKIESQHWAKLLKKQLGEFERDREPLT